MQSPYDDGWEDGYRGRNKVNHTAPLARQVYDEGWRDGTAERKREERKPS